MSPSDSTATDSNDEISRVERNRNNRIQLILSATAELIGIHGPDKVNLDEVAERLDVTKGSLYHYFASKDELVTAAITALADDVTAHLVEVVESTPGTATDRMKALLRKQLMLVLRDYPAMMHIFLFPHDLNPEDQEQVKALRRRHHRIFQSVLDAGIEADEFEMESPEVALQCVYAALNVAPLWVSENTQRGLEGRVDGRVDEIVETVMLMLGVARSA